MVLQLDLTSAVMIRKGYRFLCGSLTLLASADPQINHEIPVKWCGHVSVEPSWTMVTQY